jgi:hypothetical protein
MVLFSTPPVQTFHVEQGAQALGKPRPAKGAQTFYVEQCAQSKTRRAWLSVPTLGAQSGITSGSMPGV